MRRLMGSILRNMLVVSFTLGAVACSETTESQPIALPASQAPFEPTGAVPAIQLDRLEGSYDLPMTNLPAEAQQVGDVEEFVLTKIREYKRPGEQGRRRTSLWLARLPFNVPETAKRFKPVGMKVTISGEEIPFNTSSSVTAGGASWRIANQDLVIASRTEPKEGEVKILYPTMRSKIDAMAIGTSGLDEHDFIQREYQVKDRTRRGIMIPAPGSAEWDITLPEGARFESHLTIMDPPLRRGRSDGAKVAIAIFEGDKELFIERRTLMPSTETFHKWEVDLSKWGGKDVKLRINTHPGPEKNADYDYVFFGSPTVSGAPTDPSKVRRILIVGLDTTRADHLGVYGYDRPTSPNIDEWSKSAYVFDRAFTPAPRTRPSFRTSTTGRWPLNAVGATNIGAVFRENGWATSGCVSNIHLNPRFDFDDGFDDWRLDVQADAAQQVDRAIKYFTENQHRDAYMFLHIMDPHLFYKAPPEFNERFVTDPDPDLPPLFNRWEVVSWQNKGSLSEKRKKHIVDLYDAEIAYTDVHMGRLFEEVNKLPGQTLIIVHSDHGEEFWEHNGFEHNHTLYNELVRAVFIVQPPGGVEGGRHIDTPVSLADIGSTVFDFAGITDIPEQDGLSLRPLMEGKQNEEYQRDLPVAFLRYDRERWGVIHNGYKYILHTGSGEEELYKLDVDFGEKDNVADQLDTAPYAAALSKAYDIPAGYGWRIRVDLTGSDPIDIKLPKAALGADILNPEALSPHRANQAWGEPPKRIPSEVGEVTLAEDKMSLQFVPGPEANGVIWVHFDSKTIESPTISRGGESLTLADGKANRRTWSNGPHSLAVEPGTIVVPPVGEAARIKALRGDTSGISGDDLSLLKALGYVGEEGAEGGQPDDGHGH